MKTVVKYLNRLVSIFLCIFTLTSVMPTNNEKLRIVELNRDEEFIDNIYISNICIFIGNF